MPTVVLVHGAFADASLWATVIGELQRAGVEVVAPGLALRSLAGDAATVADVASRCGGPVLLVGHSYAGAVITVAADGAPNAVGLVYVAGFALDAGESVLDVALRFPATPLAAALRPATFHARDGTPGVELSVRSERFRDVLAHDLLQRSAAVMAAAQRPIAAAAMEERAPSAGWRSLPSWYVVVTADRAVHPGAQRFMARRAGARLIEVAASHAGALVRGEAVASLIRDVALSPPAQRARPARHAAPPAR